MTASSETGKRLGLAIAAFVAVGLIATWIVPAGGAEEVDSGSPVPNTTATIVDVRESPPGDIIWKLVTYPSADGVCQDWIAEHVESGASGMTGSCDDEGPKTFSPSVGGLELGGQWYNVIDGRGAEGASKVSVTLADGSTRDSAIDNGVWLIALPGPDPAEDNSFDVFRIQALAPDGAVVASVEPPSIRGFYDDVEQQQRDMEAELGSP